VGRTEIAPTGIARVVEGRLSVADAVEAADSTSVEAAAVKAATSEAPGPDWSVKIVGQISVEGGSVAPERAAAVL
jgi:hypothetical protein